MCVGELLLGAAAAAAARPLDPARPLQQQTDRPCTPASVQMPGRRMRIAAPAQLAERQSASLSGWCGGVYSCVCAAAVAAAQRWWTMRSCVVLPCAGLLL